MKKINLLASIVAGVFVVACNGGGGSSGGSSTPTPTPNPTITPTPSDACANGAATCGAPVGSVPTVYSQTISPAASNSLLAATTLDGTLTSTAGLYLSSTESYPLTFTVKGNTVDITVNFTIVADDANIPVGSKLPTMTPQQCIFTVVNPAPCNLNITLNGAPVGKYKVIPHIDGATEFAGVEMNFQLPTQFTLPLGTYSMGGQSFTYSSAQGVVDRCSVYSIPENEYTLVNTVNGMYACINSSLYSGCSKAKNDTEGFKPVNLPSFTNYNDDDGSFPAHYSYTTNANWNGSVFLYTYSLSYSACNGLSATQSYTFQSSSTILPYPIIGSSTMISVNKTMADLLNN